MTRAMGEIEFVYKSQALMAHNNILMSACVGPDHSKYLPYTIPI